MLGRLAQLLNGLAPGAQDAAAPEAPEARERALRLAAAALLVELSRADARVDESEQQAIARAVRDVYGLSASDTQRLLGEADRHADEAVSLYDFTRTLNDYLTPAEKFAFIRDLWRVAYADGRVDKYEDHYIRKIAELLYVPHKDFIRAKLSVVETG